MCQDIKFGVNLDVFSKVKNVLPLELEAHYLTIMEDDTLYISFEELGITEEMANDPQYYTRVDNYETGDNIEFSKDIQLKTINLYRYISEAPGYTNNVGSNTRDFCRVVANRTNAAMMPYSSIIALNSSNPGQGANGADTYSVFDWRGGARCKHFWVKYLYDTETQNLVKSPDQPTQVGKGNVPNIPVSRRREGWGTKRN